MPYSRNIQLSFNPNELNLLFEVFPKGVVAVDLETTGLSPLVDRIVEIAAIRLIPPHPERPKEECAQLFHTLINPQTLIPEVVTRIHGINDEMVAHAPTIEKALANLMTFIAGLPIIAHNAKFDLGFLVYDLHQLGHSFPVSPVFCTLNLARSAFKEMPNNKLGTLAQVLQIPLESHHRAKDDALATLYLLGKCLLELQKRDHLRLVKGAFLFDLGQFAQLKDFEIPKHLEGLIDYARDQVPVEISYRGGTVKNTFRPVKPLSLLPMPSGSILYGLCLLSNQHKSFKLSKIAEVRVLKSQDKT